MRKCLLYLSFARRNRKPSRWIGDIHLSKCLFLFSVSVRLGTWWGGGHVTVVTSNHRFSFQPYQHQDLGQFLHSVLWSSGRWCGSVQVWRFEPGAIFCLHWRLIIPVRLGHFGRLRPVVGFVYDKATLAHGGKQDCYLAGVWIWVGPLEV